GAMPLAWTHAEYIKLVLSRALGRPFDRPESVWQRYRGERPAISRVMWCEHAAVESLPQGAALTLALLEPGTFRWGHDGWQGVREQQTPANPLGLHLVEIDTTGLAAGQRVDVTFSHAANATWVGRDFRIDVTAPTAASG